jgi:hypothetical protein
MPETNQPAPVRSMAQDVALLSAIPQELSKISLYAKAHERLLMVILALPFLWIVSGRIQQVIADHDNANLNAAKITLAAQVEMNEKTAALVAKQKADYDTLASKYQAQDAALAQANVALVNALTKQQKVDAKMTDPELAARWNQLVPAAAVTITNGQAALPDAGAHATVNELEKVPVLTQQLTNEQTQLSNVNALLLASNGRVVTLNGLVDGKDAELKKAVLVCQDKIKVVKDADRKSKRRWFVIGFVAGFASRQVIKHYLGF